MLGTTAPSPPTAATGQLRVGGDSGQGEGYSGAEGPFCAQPDDRRGGRGCRPGEGGGQQSSCQDRRGGVGWGGPLQNTNRSRSSQGTGGRRLVPLFSSSVRRNRELGVSKLGVAEKAPLTVIHLSRFTPSLSSIQHALVEY